MRIAYAGDWHANFHWARQAIEYAKDNDAETIVHLGDYGYNFGTDFRTSVEASLRRTGLTLQFVDGNHEDFTWLYNQPIGEDGRRQISERVFHLPRGYRWEWEGVRFLSVGGAYSVDRRWRTLNDSWWLEEEISEEDIEKASATGPADVLVSHDVPSGFQIPGLTSGIWPRDAIMFAEEHRTRLRKIVDATQPREIWHGHYHVRYEVTADFGYGDVAIHSLDMDATSLEDNVVVVELPGNRESLPAAADVVLGTPGAN